MTISRAAGHSKAWYSRWFGEEYLQLYPHRDAGEAGRAAALVVRSARPEPGGRVLDLACGAGRHLSTLGEHGLRPVGLDLSLPLLLLAKAPALVRGDMRLLPFGPGTFQLVTSFFTSFGYFPDPREDLRVLAEVRRVLARGGSFGFDFLNARRVRELLVPVDERETDGRRVVQRRRLVEGGRVVEKRIEITGAGGESEGVFHERVRLYTVAELLELFHGAGLEPVERFGDYTGAPLERESPRVILIGRAR